MRRAFVAIACAVLLAALPAHALAGPAKNGMLAAVLDGRLVTVNPDGGGLRTLWTPAAGGGDVTGLAWSPDGNKLAFSYTGKLFVFDVPAGKGAAVTNPEGAQDFDP